MVRHAAKPKPKKRTMSRSSPGSPTNLILHQAKTKNMHIELDLCKPSKIYRSTVKSSPTYLKLITELEVAHDGCRVCYNALRPSTPLTFNPWTLHRGTINCKPLQMMNVEGDQQP